MFYALSDALVRNSAKAVEKNKARTLFQKFLENNYLTGQSEMQPNSSRTGVADS